MSQRSKLVRVHIETYYTLKQIKERLRVSSFDQTIWRMAKESTPGRAIILGYSDMLKLEQIAEREKTDIVGAVTAAIDSYGMWIERLDEIINMIKERNGGNAGY